LDTIYPHFCQVSWFETGVFSTFPSTMKFLYCIGWILDIHTWTIRSNLNNNTKSVLMSFPIWTFCMCVPVYEYSYFIPDKSSKLFRFTFFNSFYFYNFFSGAHERNEWYDLMTTPYWTWRLRSASSEGVVLRAATCMCMRMGSNRMWCNITGLKDRWYQCSHTILWVCCSLYMVWSGNQLIFHSYFT
jgi:hypothetical protein